MKLAWISVLILICRFSVIMTNKSSQTQIILIESGPVYVYTTDFYYYKCCVTYPYLKCPYFDYYCVDPAYIILNRRSKLKRINSAVTKNNSISAAKQELKYLKAIVFNDVNFDLESWRVNRESQVFNSKALKREVLITELAKLVSEYNILSKIPSE